MILTLAAAFKFVYSTSFDRDCVSLDVEYDQPQYVLEKYALITLDIAIVFAFTALAVLLFVTEWIRVDLVALLVMADLTLTGGLTPTEALSGFSNA